MQYLNKVIAATLTALLSTSVIAETRYVSDQLRITVRSGKSTGHAVLTTADSGDALQVLRDDSESGYTEVRLPNGKQGWALTRFLVSEPIARDQLAATRQQLAGNQQRLAELEPENQRLAAELKQAITERDQLQQSLSQLEQATEDTVGIIERNKTLQHELTGLKETNRLLLDKVNALSDDQRLRWFMYGGGVLSLGILFGLILPKLRMQRKAWNEF